MESVTFVQLDCHGPDYLGQLPGTLTMNQVHLEEAILAMRETRRECQVQSIHGPDDRYSGCFPLNRRFIN
jgi:hypothetical protein